MLYARFVYGDTGENKKFGEEINDEDVVSKQSRFNPRMKVINCLCSIPRAGSRGQDGDPIPSRLGVQECMNRH